MRKPLNLQSKEHRRIIHEAIHNADQFGRGRISAVCEELEGQEIEFSERMVSDYIFKEYVLKGINP